MKISEHSVRDFLERNNIDFRFTDQKIELSDIENLLIKFGLECVEKQRIIGCVSESQRITLIRNFSGRVLEDLEKSEDSTPLLKVVL